jgi:hypothetical protein
MLESPTSRTEEVSTPAALWSVQVESLRIVPFLPMKSVPGLRRIESVGIEATATRAAKLLLRWARGRPTGHAVRSETLDATPCVSGCAGSQLTLDL